MNVRPIRAAKSAPTSMAPTSATVAVVTSSTTLMGQLVKVLLCHGLHDQPNEFFKNPSVCQILTNARYLTSARTAASTRWEASTAPARPAATRSAQTDAPVKVIIHFKANNF